MSSLIVKIRVGFGLALLALGVISVVSYKTTSGFVWTLNARRQSYEVLHSLEMTLSLLKDAETGQRGYVLTGDEKYLRPYDSAIAEIQRELSRVRAGYADNPQQGARVATLDKFCAEKLSELKQTIELRRERGFEVALEVVRTDRGMQYMDGARSMIADMRAANLAELDQLNDEVKAASSATLNTVVLGSVFALAIVGLAVVAIQRDVAGRRRAEEALQHSHDELALRVDERTAELRQANDRMRGEIAERKAAQEAQQASEQRVLARSAELAEVNRELAQKNQENEMFVYSVSHDLRSPLVNLQGFSQELSTVSKNLREILAQPEVPSQLQRQGLELIDCDASESIGFIQNSVMRLSGIIDALLRLSRAGRIEYQQKPVNVQAAITTILTSLAGTIDEKGAQITVASLPAAWGDPTAIEQIFGNLIGNALNYLDPQRLGFIDIGCTTSQVAAEPDHEPKSHTYYVRDNGLGIPEAYRGKLFRAFQRLHPQVAKGEGMGLAMVRRIVERHAGKIWVESTASVGSTFFVMLPAREAHSSNLAARENWNDEDSQTEESAAARAGLKAALT